ncbi:hypothetical protein KC887_03025 [Candidatus Kaiserbacteria bacterium]|nr:hypothetical protein [Candidatus Kaiserbacteria bacterium]
MQRTYLPWSDRRLDDGLMSLQLGVDMFYIKNVRVVLYEQLFKLVWVELPLEEEVNLDRFFRAQDQVMESAELAHERARE